MKSGLATLNMAVSGCTQGLAGWREGGCEELKGRRWRALSVGVKVRGQV